jgi:integrase
MEYLTPQELEKLMRITHASNSVCHLAILVACATGARTSQILGDRYEYNGEERRVQGLTGTDVYQQEGRLRVHAAKRGKSRFYNLPEHPNPAFNLRQPLIEQAKIVGSGKLFGGLTRQYLDKCLKKYGKEAGIHPSLCHLHAIRHGVAMIILDSTQRPGAITNFLGHKDDSSAFPYMRENDGKRGDKAVADFWANLGAA